MAKLTISDAARACNVARTTLQRAVKTGRLSLDAEHRVDTAELLRVGYHLDAAVLHAASQQEAAPTQHHAAAGCCSPGSPITYHPQSGWFEDTPLKRGTEEGCPLKGVHEATCLIEAGHPAWNHSRASCLTVILRLGLLCGLGSGAPPKTSSPPTQRRNGRACSSLTARGGGLPI
jgi:uncharacterized protein (DUF779 family)